MKKEERIKRYGEAAYEKKLQQNQDWASDHPEETKANQHENGRKGGKYYEQHQKYKITGLQGERNRIRNRHRHHYHPYKQIIAPESQIHHQWLPETANFTGVALVEADQHMHGYIDVIQILEGEITLLSEAEIRNNGEMSE